MRSKKDKQAEINKNEKYRNYRKYSKRLKKSKNQLKVRAKYQKRQKSMKKAENIKKGREIEKDRKMLNKVEFLPSVVAFLNGRFLLPQSFDRLEHSRRFELFDRPAVDAANEFGHFCRSFFVFELKFEQIHRLDQRLHRQNDISNDPSNKFLNIK
jgi:hypothetical protein